MLLAAKGIHVPRIDVEGPGQPMQVLAIAPSRTDAPGEEKTEVASRDGVGFGVTRVLGEDAAGRGVGL